MMHIHRKDPQDSSGKPCGLQQVVHPGSEMRVTPTKTSEILYHVG